MTKNQMICSQCGTTTQAKEGISTVLTVIAMILIFPLGLLLAVMKWFEGRNAKCGSCSGVNTLVAMESPRGQKLSSEYAANKAA